MGNVIRIAKKEFADLLGNRIVFLLLAIFAVIIILNAQGIDDYMDYMSSGLVMWDMYGNSVSNLLLGGILTCLTFFGEFVGVIVGFSIFAGDRYSYSLNTLLVKPLYRDSIINGKLLGALGFLACICGFTIMLSVACMLIFAGNYAAPYLLEFLSRLPLVFLVVLAFMMIYMALSMLLSLVIPDQSLALISILLLVVIINSANAVDVAAPFGVFFNSSLATKLVAGLSPHVIRDHIYNAGLFNPSYDFFSALSVAKFDILWMVLYAVIPVLFSYIVFLRRDVS